MRNKGEYRSAARSDRGSERGCFRMILLSVADQHYEIIANE
jgi:hypothetical protein